MKIKVNSGGNFEPHPETDSPVRAVVVDVTPLKQITTQFGDKQVFKLVFETEVEREDGTRYCVWSRSYSPSLHEKSSFRKDLKQLRGRDLDEEETKEGFDPEDLMGSGARLMISHQEGSNGQTYATIVLMKPDPKPIRPSGSYTRVQDREEKAGQNGAAGKKPAYKHAPKETGRDDWQKVKVHVGKHAGVDLGDLEQEAVEALVEKWLPKHEANPKPSADDKRLAAALATVQALLASGGDEAEEDDDVEQF